jgi:hypothetical protein
MLGNQEGVASAVVGSMWSIPDEPAEAGKEFTLAFYSTLFNGAPIAEALRSARLLARNEKKWGPMVWGPYVLYGDPGLVPFQPKATSPEEQNVPAGVPASRGGEKPGTDEVARDTIEEAFTSPVGELAMDDSFRKVIRLAARECMQQKQPGIGTMHLLIGLCGVGAEANAFSAALREKRVNAEDVAGSARLIAAGISGASEQGLGISANAVMVIQLAILRAQILSGMSVAADDLLAALLDWGEGTALRVLEQHGLALSDLLPRVPQIRIGALSRDNCTPEVWRLLMTALLRAGGRPLDTTSLFRAMLRAPGGATEKAFRRLGIDPNVVRAALRQMSLEG